MTQTDFQAVITQAALDKAVTADANGVSLTISEIGISETGMVADRNTSAIPNEIGRYSIASSKDVAGNQVHLTALIDEGSFSIRTVGFYLDDGTLFAVWSDLNQVLFHKTTDARIVQGFDLILESVPPGSVAVQSTGDANIYFAPELVTQAIAQAQMATSVVSMLHRQIQINDRLINAGV